MARITSFTPQALHAYSPTADGGTSPTASQQDSRSKKLGKKFFRLFQGPRKWFASGLGGNRGSSQYRRYSEPQTPELPPAHSVLLASELNKELDRQNLRSVLRQQPDALIAKLLSPNDAVALAGLREFAERANEDLLKILPSRYVSDALNDYTTEQAVAEATAPTPRARPDAGTQIIFRALRDFIVDHFGRATGTGSRDSDAAVAKAVRQLV